MSIIVLVLPTINTFSQLPSNRVVDFEGTQWRKEMRDRAFPWGDVYSAYNSQVIWDNSNSELTAEEDTATNNVYVGVSINLTASKSVLDISLDAKISATHPSPIANGVVVILFEVGVDGEWVNPDGQTLTTSTTYQFSSIQYKNLVVGNTYALFLCYSDGWAPDYNQKMYVKNITLTFSDPVVPMPTRLIDFEGSNWRKEMRTNAYPWGDVFSTYNSQVIWDNSNSELTAEEDTATSNVYVGVSINLTASKSVLDISLDAKIYATHPSPIANGVVVSLFEVGVDGEWVNPDGQTLTSSTTFQFSTIQYKNLVVGNTYALFLYYSDGWVADYNQKMYVKNITLAFSDPMVPMPTRLINFEGMEWRKEIRDRAFPWGDVYSAYNSQVIWDNSNSELTAEEDTATSNVYVGVSINLTASKSILELSLDTKIYATNPSPIANGVVASLFEWASDGEWSNPDGQILTTSTSYESSTIQFVNLKIGGLYALLLYYSDGWDEDYDQKMHIKNIDISFVESEPIQISTTSELISTEGLSQSDPSIALPMANNFIFALILMAIIINRKKKN